MPVIDCILAIVISPIVGVWLGTHIGTAVGDLAGWPRVPFYNLGGALLFEG
jgi:hypothetical protein